MTEVSDLVQAKKDVAERTEPPTLYNIICHADPAKYGDAVLETVMLHTLHRHVGLTFVVSMLRVRQALTRGRIVVKFGLTQEVAETILADVEQCVTRQLSKSFSLKLEKVQ